MPQMQNVVVFGDSLSDIGKKWKTAIGRIGRKKGEMVVNASGRFSDTKNWTDFMYEEASASKTLIYHNPKNTISASKVHHKFGPQCVVRATGGSAFRYANYAEGGACGDAPFTRVMRWIALTTFQSQWESFSNDVIFRGSVDPRVHEGMKHLRGDNWLFFIWFGANDLFTAQSPPDRMKKVAEKVGEIRNRLAAYVHQLRGHAFFVVMNLAYAKNTPRFNDPEFLKKEKITPLKMSELNEGVAIYNSALESCIRDPIVDIGTLFSDAKFAPMLAQFNLTFEKDMLGSSALPRPPEEYKKLQAVSEGKEEVLARPGFTEDGAHPTARVYYAVWQEIRRVLLDAKYTFGALTVPAEPAPFLPFTPPAMPEFQAPFLPFTPPPAVATPSATPATPGGAAATPSSGPASNRFLPFDLPPV